MPKISIRGAEMPASPIRRLIPFAEAAKKRGTHVFHLNIGQPDIETPSSFLDAIRNADLKVVEYSHSAGNESYRRKVAAYYQERGLSVETADVMITTGGSEAILFAMMCCLDPGDEVIIPEPFYANYNGFARAAGVTVIPVTAHVENGFALPEIAEFEKKITSRTKAIIICNPNNPTGYLYSKEELERLRDLVTRHDLFLFADEVYREFCYDQQTHTSVLSIDGLEAHAIVVDSISKRYSACGARIGWIVSKNAAVMASALKFGQARLSPPTFEQIGGEAALDTPQSYFDHVLEEYVKRRDLVVKALRSMPGVVCPNPGGAFYATVRLPIDDSDKFCRWMLEQFSHKGKTVMMAPATGFYATPGLGKNEVRIAYVLNLQDLQEAMEALSEALSVYPGRTI